MGVVGWHIGGGYGSLSKMFGTGPANLLEAMIVTAGGDIVIASECENADLFYALRGGGYGFGVIVSLTVRTHVLPKYIGNAEGSITTEDAEAAIEIVAAFLDFYNSSLSGPNWGESVVLGKIGDEYRLDVHMMNVGLTRDEADLAWQPMKEWALQRPGIRYDVTNIVIPAKLQWNSKFQTAPWGGGSQSPYDPLEPERAFYWKGNVGEISAYWMTYFSRFLTMEHIMEDVNIGAKKHK